MPGMPQMPQMPGGMGGGQQEMAPPPDPVLMAQAMELGAFAKKAEASKLSLCEELQKFMFDLSRLVDQYENKDMMFVQGWKDWMLKCEKILGQHKVSKVADFAIIRSAVASAERGVVDSDKYSSVGNITSAKKMAMSIAALSLERAQITLSAILLPLEERIEQAKEITAQVLAIAWQKGTLKDHWTPGQPFTKKQELWTMLMSREDVQGGITKVLSAVSMRDALTLVDRTLNEWSRAHVMLEAEEKKKEEERKQREEQRLKEEEEKKKKAEEEVGESK